MWLSPYERRRRSDHLRWWGIALCVGYLVCALFDRSVFLAFTGQGYKDNDWGRMFRIAGFLPTWLVIAAALAMVDRGRDAAGGTWRRAWPLIVGTVASGLAAEILKRLIGRERPGGEHMGVHFYKPFLHGLWDHKNLGIPSSHAAVAFGAAFMLVRLFPPLWPVALLLAVGCATQRVACGAHFMSDVYAAAVLAYAVTAWVSRYWPSLSGRESTRGAAAPRGTG